MLNPVRVSLAFERFAKAVVKQARARLSKGGNKTTGKLYDSLDNWSVNVSRAGSVSLEFSYEDYGDFLDKGVKGAANFKSYKMAEFTPFRFRDKMPPRRPIERFIKAKGLNVKPFVMQRSIYQKGIPQTLFFTKPFRNNFKNLPEGILDAFGDDVERFLTAQLNDTQRFR